MNHQQQLYLLLQKFPSSGDWSIICSACTIVYPECEPNDMVQKHVGGNLATLSMAQQVAEWAAERGVAYTLGLHLAKYRPGLPEAQPFQNRWRITNSLLVTAKWLLLVGLVVGPALTVHLVWNNKFSRDQSRWEAHLNMTQGDFAAKDKRLPDAMMWYGLAELAGAQPKNLVNLHRVEQELKAVYVHELSVGGMAVSKNGRSLGVWNQTSGSFELWDLSKGTFIRSVGSPVISLCFSDDGQRLYGADDDGSVWRWHFGEQEFADRKRGGEEVKVQTMCLTSHEGQDDLLVACHSEGILFLDSRSLSERYAAGLQGWPKNFSVVDFSVVDDLVVVGGKQNPNPGSGKGTGLAAVWRLNRQSGAQLSLKLIGERTQSYSITAVAISSGHQGKPVIAVGDKVGVVTLHKVEDECLSEAGQFTLPKRVQSLQFVSVADTTNGSQSRAASDYRLLSTCPDSQVRVTSFQLDSDSFDHVTVLRHGEPPVLAAWVAEKSDIVTSSFNKSTCRLHLTERTLSRKQPEAIEPTSVQDTTTPEQRLKLLEWRSGRSSKVANSSNGCFPLLPHSDWVDLLPQRKTTEQ